MHSVREHFRPDDTIRDAKGDVHTVFKASSSGYGFAAILMTTYTVNDRVIRYGTWVVSPEGRARVTMTSGDFRAVHDAYRKRILGQLDAERDVLTPGMTEAGS